MSFSLDGGQQQGSFSVSEASPGTITARRLLWQSLTTDDKQHTLTIQHESTLTNPVILLDYIMYAATDDTPRSGLQYFVDERDSRIKYGSGWEKSGVDWAMEGTTTTATQAESDLEFQFEGKTIFTSPLFLY